MGEVDRALTKLRIADPDVGSGIGVSGGNDPTDEECVPDISEVPDDTIINSIQSDERGFSKMETTVRDHISLNGDIRSFYLFWGEIGKISDALCLDLNASSSSIRNGVLCAKTADGEFQRIIFNPYDLNSTANLRQIETWAKETATIQSHRITITLAFVWALISLM